MLFFSQVVEACLSILKAKENIPYRPVTMLREDDISGVGSIRFTCAIIIFPCIVVVTMNEYNHVCLLLNFATLTKVRHLRYLIGSSFHCSVELRECQDRDIKLTCHILESTRYLGDFLVSLTNEIGRAACRGRG